MSGIEPLFVDGGSGRLFLMHYSPAAECATGECVLVLPAFAEEMNKSRRQLALLGRALAARGVATLIPDLAGTGDSAGTLADATVDLWLDDLARAVGFARERGYRPPRLLGLRAGALLAAPLIAAQGSGVSRVLLWQPHTAGSMLVNQFLRLRVAAGLMGAADGPTVKDLRAGFDAGRSVEVAGYWLAPPLIAGLDALNLADLATLPPCRLDWFSLGRADATPTPVARRLIGALEAASFDVSHRLVVGDPFWSTAEIATVPALNDATVEALT